MHITLIRRCNTYRPVQYRQTPPPPLLFSVPFLFPPLVSRLIFAPHPHPLPLPKHTRYCDVINPNGTGTGLGLSSSGAAPAGGIDRPGGRQQVRFWTESSSLLLFLAEVQLGAYHLVLKPSTFRFLFLCEMRLGARCIAVVEFLLPMLVCRRANKTGGVGVGVPLRYCLFV